MTEIEETLCNLLTGIEGVTVIVSADTNLLAELELESIQIMEFIMEVEDHYDIIIAEQKLSAVNTIEDLATIVASELQ